MKNIRMYKYLLVFLVVGGLLSGCSLRCKTDPIPGTETAAVIISVGKNKIPKVNKEVVTVYPGQRLVFVGPEKFILRYREEFPFERDDENEPDPQCPESTEICTDDGVITLRVLEKYGNILKQKDVDEILIKYDVIVNGVVLDPYVRIIEQ